MMDVMEQIQSCKLVFDKSVSPFPLPIFGRWGVSESFWPMDLYKQNISINPILYITYVIRKACKFCWLFNINEGQVLLKLADTVLILINTDPSNVRVSCFSKKISV